MSNFSAGHTSSMLSFQRFTESLAITDLNFSGKYFTWWDCNINSPSFKKLDRALVNESWLVQFPASHCNFLPRGLSDHSPVLITEGFPAETVKKPFQVFKHIIDHAEFLSSVSEAWSCSVQGNPWFVLTTKLKRVKDKLKLLNKKCGNLRDAVNLARSALLAYQSNSPLVPDNSYLLEESRLCKILAVALSNEECFLKQKSRVNWLKSGDSNSKFFFKACLNRWNTNKIVELTDGNGEKVYSHRDISRVAVDYFKHKLNTSLQVLGLDDNLDIPKITSSQSDLLCRDFGSDDVLKALKQMGKDKSPGPDGFSPEFYIAAWPILGTDVTAAILHFFNTLSLPRMINSTAIALVPKSAGASDMSQFRPISCCNTLYKCISKLLVSRLKHIMPTLISQNQSAFIKGRSIGDNIMLAQAICKDYHVNRGVPRCLLKLDIQRAFDSMNWEFILETLHRMNFPARFINWISKCICSCMFSVKVNGALEGFFSSSCGLRQGDPLSPYLFVIGMEVLTAYLNCELATDTHFKYHWRTSQLKLSHLIFADDLLLFCRGDSSSISTLLKAIDHFSASSGLIPNPLKSNWFFCNVPADVIQQATSSSNIQVGILPIKYLGLPLLSTRVSKSDCVPLVQRLCGRINSWINISLRFSGRLQLIKAILFNIQGFWSTYLFLPKGVLKNIRSILAKFLWGGKLDTRCHYKVAWDTCCALKEDLLCS